MEEGEEEMRMATTGETNAAKPGKDEATVEISVSPPTELVGPNDLIGASIWKKLAAYFATGPQQKLSINELGILMQQGTVKAGMHAIFRLRLHEYRTYDDMDQGQWQIAGSAPCASAKTVSFREEEAADVMEVAASTPKAQGNPLGAGVIKTKTGGE